MQKKSLSLLHISKKSSTFAPNFFKYPNIMAKQSGLHQIRGKVGEYSYYRQSGIASGLIKSINQGLSSRVKTGDEYANTRLNNAEFGAACNIAGELGKMVTPKYRPMILPFSQSKMAKQVLELARSHAGLWGRRVVTADDTPALADILTATSKLNLLDYMSITVDRTSQGVATVSFTMEEAQISQMIGLGIDGFDIKGSLYLLRSGSYSEITDRILHASLRMQATSGTDEGLSIGEPVSDDFEISVGVAPIVTGFVNHRIITIVVLPYRNVGTSKYTLQEYCMFLSVQLPETE